MIRSKKFLALLLAALSLSTGLVACGGGSGGGGDVDLDDDGNLRPGGGNVTKITFWGYGDENETQVFRNLVTQFNEEYKDSIFVNYDPKVSSDYSTTASSALRQTKAKVDILYVGDSALKYYAEMGWLEPLDSYLETSKEVVIEDMWETSVNRFKYDVKTTTQNGPDAHYWGIPKDIGPTVI